MKIRREIIWLIIVTIVVITLILCRKKGSLLLPTHETGIRTNALASENGALITSQSQSIPSNAPAEIGGTDHQNTPSLSKTEKLIGILSTLNDTPIVFYGKIQDQFSNVVAGAMVNFDVRVINGFEATAKRGHIVSDVDGLITIEGYRGQDLAFNIQKEGYTFVSMNGSGNYSQLSPEDQRAHPDPKNPTIINMWKLQGPEPLLNIKKAFRLSFNENPIHFDLVSGNVVPAGGDLEVIVSRDPGIITQRHENHKDWSIKLIPVDGGIIETDYHIAQVTFEAPASGYEGSYFAQMNRDEPGWFDNIQKDFFLMSRNGQVYSRLSFDFKINDDPNDPLYFGFKGVANTNSSRNWEATAPQ
jgi:hypothetical protein